MNEIGSALHEARESSGVSLEEASNDLEIKVEILENIEDGRTGAFKDIFDLKKYIAIYAKYLGLDDQEFIDRFNEHMFEYTSRIPVKEIEKTIEQKNKEEKHNEIASPYTRKSNKYGRLTMILIYIIIVVLVICAMVWSVKQVTTDKSVTKVSYGGYNEFTE